MAKKRKDRKVSKRKLRPKNKIRSGVNKMKTDGKLKKTELSATAIEKVFKDAFDNAPVPPGTRAVRYLVFPKGVGVVYVKSGERTKDRVMQIDFTKTPPRGQDELNDSLRAIMEINETSLGGGEGPPKVIAVAANADDKDSVTSQLEKMVADMNEEARDDNTKIQYRIDLISSSLKLTGLLSKRQVNLRYELIKVEADTS
jgi:hypothetical protein